MDGAILLPLLCSRMGKWLIVVLTPSFQWHEPTAELSGSMPMEVWTAVSNRAQELQVPPFALQPDGKVLVCPYFNAVSGTNYNTIYRLNADAVGTPVSTGRSKVMEILFDRLRADGKVLISGTFTQ